MSRIARLHGDWRQLLEPVEPFLTVPVLKRVFPDGLPSVTTARRAEVRTHLGALGAGGAPAERSAWIGWALGTLLGHGPRLRHGAALPAGLEHAVPEHGVVLRADYAVVGPGAPGEDAPERPRLLVRVVKPGTPIVERIPGDRWAASQLERTALLCRAAGCELGVVTDGDRWVLAWAPPGRTGGHGTFTAQLFSEEPALLDAFVALLGAARLFAVRKGDHLEALFHESASAEEEVTTRLGAQVRAATELLVAAVSRANRETGGALLRGVEPGEVYNGALTVMMRMVFLLAAEERGLLPLGDDFYDRSYAASTLREQLVADASRLGDEALEHRQSAWHRLLALARAVHGGVSHGDLAIPPYGGGLFDPDRYPFLEGRAPGEPWREHASRPVPIDDRTVLEILDSLQVLRFGKAEARTLSYRSLEVEQIGHVYEGLLDHSAVRVDDLALGLVGKSGSEPEIPLAELEDAAAHGRERYLAFVAERTGWKVEHLARLLDRDPTEERERLLRVAAENDAAAYDRLRPHLPLLRDDVRGLPTVFLPGAVYVTETSTRRETGTAYTHRALADEVVRYALEPLVYSPGPADEPDPARWKLKPAHEILALKVCDPAVGSGAIIVAACRYLADRVVEAWTAEREAGGEPLLGDEPAWAETPEGTTLQARRAVADRCLYGVDLNPMAVEMAKLSMWLVTMARDRPFTFLDHAFKVGDSLLGITSLDQLASLHMDPERGRRVHEQGHLFNLHFDDVLRPLLETAIEDRCRLEAIPLFTVRDVETKISLNAQADHALERLWLIADVIVGAALASAEHRESLIDEYLTRMAPLVARIAAPEDEVDDDTRARSTRLLREYADEWLSAGRPAGNPPRKPFHWPLVFPEVFVRSSCFDAMVGNPPFLGGKRIRGAVGSEYREYLVKHVANGRRGSADLVAYFFLRASQIASAFGLLATNTLSQGDTREVGLDHITGAATWVIYRAVKSEPWPGGAALEIAKVWATQRKWRGTFVLNGAQIGSGISPLLDLKQRVQGNPYRLRENAGKSHIGSLVLGTGFILTPAEAEALIAKSERNRDVLYPYLSGKDVSSRPDQSASRWVINLGDRSEAKAAEYPDVFEIVIDRVKPERDKKARKQYREKWWQFAERQGRLYEAITAMQHVVCLTLVGKNVLPAIVPTGQVFSHKLGVFAYDDYAHFGLLTSAFHWWWSVTHTSTLETRVNYSVTDCFETFPRPAVGHAVAHVGERLHIHRDGMLRAWKMGLTDLYNLVNDPENRDPDVQLLRTLHAELDEAVKQSYMAADPSYMWNSVVLGHDFHQTSFGQRWTIGPAARIEILDRLLELNFARHAQEELAVPMRARRGGRKATAVGQESLFGDGND
jgi:hypothetical protein